VVVARERYRVCSRIHKTDGPEREPAGQPWAG
jgi:hypothetical protein